MSEPNTTTTEDKGQTPDAEVTPGQTPSPAGKTPDGQQSTQKTKIEELPEDIQEYIERLRKENETNRKAAEKAARESKQREDTQLAEQGKYKELAEKHEARLKELEPVAEKYNALAERQMKALEAQIKDWPKEVKDLDPGKDAGLEARLDWAERVKPLVEKLIATQQQAGRSGNPPPPRAVGATNKSAFDGKTPEQRVAELRRSGRYG